MLLLTPHPLNVAQSPLATAIRRLVALTALAVFVGFGPIPVVAAENPAFVSGASSLVGDSPTIHEADIGSGGWGAADLATLAELAEYCPPCVVGAIILAVGSIVAAIIMSGSGDSNEAFEDWLEKCAAVGGIPTNVQFDGYRWSAECEEAQN